MVLSSLWGLLSLQRSTVDLFRERGPAPFKAESDLLAADLHVLIVVAPELSPQALLPRPHDGGAPGNSEMFGWNFHKTTQYLLRCCSQSIPNCYHSGLGFPLLPVVPGVGGTDGVRCGRGVGRAIGTSERPCGPQVRAGPLGPVLTCAGSGPHPLRPRPVFRAPEWEAATSRLLRRASRRGCLPGLSFSQRRK